jgi:hypothetical protein
MAMLLNSQYSEARLTADVLLGEELPDAGGIQADLKKLNALVASRKATGGRAITPADLVGDGRGRGDLGDVAAADRRLTKLLASRGKRR